MEPRPLTVDELRPHFTMDGAVHLELALTRYYSAAKDAELAELRAAVAPPALEAVPEAQAD